MIFFYQRINKRKMIIVLILMIIKMMITLELIRPQS